MRLDSIVCRAGKKPFRWFAAGVILLFLVLNCLAVSPVLHRFFHQDADDHNHHCAVTLLAHGQVEMPQPHPPLVSEQQIVSTFNIVEILTSEANFDLLPPSRAPPLPA